jgi:type VI secretion system protein VasJ
VRSFVEPISAATPTGTSARADPRFDAINVEVTKQDSLEPKPVAWPAVVDRAGKFLQTVSKDLLVGSYMALGLLHTEKLPGLTKGLVLLAELLDKYPDNVFPERPKGRANALLYALERLTTREGTGLLQREPWKNVTAADKVPLDELTVAVGQLETVSRAQLGPATPGFVSLFQEIGALQAALPAPAPPPQPVAPTPPPTSTNGATATAAVAAAPPPPPPQAVSAPVAVALPEASGDFAAFLPQMGEALVSAANAARRANPKEAAPYRALRVGLYLHIMAPPPAGPGGRSSLPGLADNRRDQIEKMRQHGRSLEIIEEAESALSTGRFALDLHRYSAEALAALGPEYQAARKALVAETGAMLRRFPELLNYQTAAGKPLADPATREWIEAEVVPPAAAGKGSADGGADTAAIDDARKLASSGNIEEALAALMPRATGSASARDRFLARLAVAQVLSAASQHAVARAHFEALDKEVLARALDEWDPALARVCLEAHLQCLRTLARATPGAVVPGALAVIYDRLSKLDPVAALRAGT